MTKVKALHPSDEVDRLYVSSKEWGGGLASVEGSIDASIQRYEDYIKKAQRKTIHSHQKQILTTRRSTERK